jgi:hypothetical protein
MNRLSILLLAAMTASGMAEEVAAVRGVNPADNLTKFEFLPKFTMLDEGSNTSNSSTTFKYDRAIQGIYGVNFELPLGYFDSPASEEFGIGDLNLRGRYQHSFNAFTFVGGLEAVLPTASEDELGSGKLQLNPVLAGVYSFNPQTFAALTAKHFFSVAGESDRDDIVQGQYRLILARTTESGWWFLADPQLWVDYEKDDRVHFTTEVEIGKMLTPNTSIWLRGGGHIAGDWDKDDWTISAGFRFIKF